MARDIFQTEPADVAAGIPLLEFRSELLSRREDDGSWLAPVPIYAVADLGYMVKAQRKAQGLTQTEFARRAGLGRRFISELEAGKPTTAFNHVLRACHVAGLGLSATCRRPVGYGRIRTLAKAP
jgi:y4mF family transcriptional regulator